MANIKKTFTASSLPVAFNRGDSIPIDKSLVWYSFEELENYAKTGATAYVGQILAYVDEAAGTSTAYIIADEAGTLKEVGSATVGDDKTIVLNNNALALKNWGVQYYRWEEGTDEDPGKHVLQVVDDDHPWIAGLEPKVATGADGVLVLEWYQPSSTTIEGVSSIVGTLQTSVENLTKAVGTAEDDAEAATVYGAIAAVKQDYLPLAGGVLTGALTLSDGGEAASKTYVANSIASAGHLKRLVVAALPAVEDADPDTIYMVKDSSILSGDSYKEYMLIDGAFAQIGDTSVDLEPYATKTALQEQEEALTTSIGAVEGVLTTHTENAEIHTSAAEKETWNAAAEKVDGLAAIKSIGDNLTLSEDGVLAAQGYELPTASATTLGGVKVGDNVSIDEEGKLSVPAASATTAGVLAAADYVKLQNLPANAQENVVVGALLNGEAATINEDKQIVIPLATETAGLVVSSEENNQVKVSEDGKMEVNSLSISRLEQAEDEVLVLFGGNA